MYSLLVDTLSCVTNFCDNGGTCVNKNQNAYFPRCECPNGWTGLLCDVVKAKRTLVMLAFLYFLNTLKSL